MRVRASISLLAALLLAIVLISGYTIRMVLAQQNLLDKQVQEFRTRSLAHLANRIDQVLLNRIRIQVSEIKGRLSGQAAAAETGAETEGWLVLDPNYQISRRWAASPEFEEQSLDHWLIDKMMLDDRPRPLSDLQPHIFVEKIRGKFCLFSVFPAPGPGEGWMIVHFNLPKLLEYQVKPLLDEFSESMKGEIELVDPEAWDNDDDESQPYVAWPIAHVLNGWMLSYTPLAPDAYRVFSMESTSIIGITSAVVLALIMATFSVRRELQRERALMELKNRFVANVTHELKTPLALIRMYAETLYLGRVQEPERQHQYHHTILRKAERLSEMINNVLDFSSMSHRERAYLMKDTDLRETVEQFTILYTGRLEEAGLRLNTHLDANLPPVNHNRHGIIQILINLVDNAMKYGASGGMVAIDLHARGDVVALAVTDFGPGIPEEERERLLQPFERGADADPSSGTGLGLALVEQIAKAHHAELRMNTPDGRKGLVVTLLLPISRPV